VLIIDVNDQFTMFLLIKVSYGVTVSLMSKSDGEISRIRILHVDEDDCFLEVAKACLEKEGSIEVETTMSVDEAFRKLKTKRFDAIVSSERICQKNAFEFLKELRERRNDTPFIILVEDSKTKVSDALNCDEIETIDKFDTPEKVYKELLCGIKKSVRRKSGNSPKTRRRSTVANPLRKQRRPRKF
jgi:DNA-binding NtrC family response regulator